MASKTVDLRVDMSSVKNQMRQAAEEFAKLNNEVNKDSTKASEVLLRAFAEKARMYTTSAKETLRSLDSQSRDFLERRKQERDQERRYIEDVRAGKVEGVSYSREKYQKQVSALEREEIGDRQLIKEVKEVVNAIRETGKAQIRENRKAVEDSITKSKSVDRLYQKGDDSLGLLDETLKQDELSRIKRQESVQRGGFNLRSVIPIGQQVAEGNLGGAAAGGAMRMLGSAATNPYVLLAAAALGTAGGVWLANKAVGENLRGYGVSSQMSINEMIPFRRSLSGSGYHRFGMTGNEVLAGSTTYNRAMGGRDFSGQELTGLTAITKSRDVSSELLSQTIGYGRYSNSGNLTTVITNLEDSIRKMYGGEEFKRKLIQLPEMMQVYNSLAAQMIATTGRVDQAKLSSFIGGVGSTFGVEGQNLQRYSSGIKGMMGNTGNRVIGSIQAELIRKKYPHLSGADLYQKMLEIQEAPQDNPWFMEGTWSGLQNWGGDFGESVNPNFRSAAMKYGGFGAAEAREMFGKSLQFDYNSASKGLSQSDAMEKFIQAAEKFYTPAEQQKAWVKDAAQDIVLFLGSLVQDTGEGASLRTTTVKNLSSIGQNPNSLLPQPK